MKPIVNEEDVSKLKIILPVTFTSPTIVTKYKELVTAVDSTVMRREFVNTCDMFLGNVEKSRVRRIYKEFTEDLTADESETDARVKLAFDLKDPELITDLWHFNEGKISIYDTFWNMPKNS
ncbi:hypothetical protein C1645_813388 [Glomus cerebriforme]|uniref:Uncharacterized protein n=1 Tax=Glomus cerebriforme TaxID=658196 RepID=A0A397TSZ5_9GLOM|nr:hypothetical protein C1645_813388 [Glomus cerebriforme]